MKIVNQAAKRVGRCVTQGLAVCSITILTLAYAWAADVSTKVESVKLHSSGVVTLEIDSVDTFSACTSAGNTIMFPYAPGTLSESYYGLLVTARAASMPIVVEYVQGVSECEITALRLAQ